MNRLINLASCLTLLKISPDSNTQQPAMKAPVKPRGAKLRTCRKRTGGRIFKSSMADNEQLTHEGSEESLAGDIRTRRLEVDANEAGNQ